MQQKSLKTERNLQSRDVVGIACARMRLGAQVGARLLAAGFEAGDAEAMAVADILKVSAAPESLYTAEGLHNEGGELFEGTGSLAFGSSRFDPNYMAYTSGRARKKIRAAFARVRPQSGDIPVMVTLTMPTLIGVGFASTLKVFDAAWVKFRKCDWWRERVRGCTRGEEFTLGDDRRLAGEEREWDFERDGYHFHAHIVGWSKYLNWIELGEHWTRCLATAAAERGVVMEFNTTHGRAVVDVRRCTPKGEAGKRAVALDDAVNEAAKYITKGSSFLKIPAAQLIEVERALRGRRMVELYGECNERKGSAGRERRQQDDAATGKASGVTIEERIKALRAEGDFDPKRGIDDVLLARCAESEMMLLLALQPSTQAEVLRRTAYLDNQNTIDGGGEGCGGVRDGTIAVKRRRSEPLRAVGAAMIRAGKRVEWLEMLQAVFSARREWRKCDLARRFPYATFRTLAGEVWYGVGVVQPGYGEPTELFKDYLASDEYSAWKAVQGTPYQIQVA
jgi:hypothetical protein